MKILKLIKQYWILISGDIVVAVITAGGFASHGRLGQKIDPLFVVTLLGFSTIGLLIWQTAYCFFFTQGRQLRG